MRIYHGTTLGSVLFAAIICIATSCAAGAKEDPRGFVRRFCISEVSWAIRGLPTPRDEPLYDSFLGVELIGAIRDANYRLQEWVRQNRGSKENLMIPHIESNLFSGFSEGATTWQVGRSIKTRSGVTVDVHREYKEGNTVYKWVDRIVLDRAGKDWVVQDIDCHYGGSLLSNIRDFKNSI
jgi:hypothetical protein